VPFGLGTTELIIILALALLILGPKRLPDVGRTLGRGMREFKSTMSDIEDVKKSTIGQVDELKDSLKVDLSPDGSDAKAKGSKTTAAAARDASAKEPGARAS
jgi:sec-independent protein translocase protein TatB